MFATNMPRHYTEYVQKRSHEIAAARELLYCSRKTSLDINISHSPIAPHTHTPGFDGFCVTTGCGIRYTGMGLRRVSIRGAFLTRIRLTLHSAYIHAFLGKRKIFDLNFFHEKTIL